MSSLMLHPMCGRPRCFGPPSDHPLLIWNPPENSALLWYLQESQVYSVFELLSSLCLHTCKKQAQTLTTTMRYTCTSWVTLWSYCSKHCPFLPLLFPRNSCLDRGLDLYLLWNIERMSRCYKIITCQQFGVYHLKSMGVLTLQWLQDWGP